MKKLITFSFIFAFVLTAAMAQKTIYATLNNGYNDAYVVKVNPKNGAMKKIAKLGHKIGVVTTGSAYDVINGRYFVRIEYGGGRYLAICDVNNGNLTQVSVGDSFPNSLQYDPVTGTLYGVQGSGKNEYVCSVDTSTGAATKIGYIKINGYNFSTFDHVNGYYILEFQDTLNKPRVAAINVSTGAVVYNRSLDTLNSMQNICYNQGDGKFYGLTWDNTNKAEYITSLDPATGYFSTILTVNSLTGVEFTDVSFDDVNGKFTFLGVGSNNKVYLYTADIATATITYQPKLPATLNLMELHSEKAATNLSLSVVQGNVGTSANTPMGFSTIYLYSNKGVVLDSMLNDGSGDYMFSQPTGSYYVSAVPNTSNTGKQLPTYYGSAISIHNAKAIDVTTDVANADFKTLQAKAPTASGNISGTVFLSQTCDNTPGKNPAVGVKLFLADASGNAQFETVTDANGKFSFKNVDIATYSVWVDNMTIDNTNSPFIKLSSEASTKSNVDINMCSDKLAIAGTSGIAGNEANSSSFTTFPNPFSQVLNIQYELSVASPTEVVITDIAGKEIYHVAENMTLAGVHQLNIQNSETGLKPGIYFLNFKSESFNTTRKIVCN